MRENNLVRLSVETTQEVYWIIRLQIKLVNSIVLCVLCLTGRVSLLLQDLYVPAVSCGRMGREEEGEELCLYGGYARQEVAEGYDLLAACPL